MPPAIFIPTHLTEAQAEALRRMDAYGRLMVNDAARGAFHCRRSTAVALHRAGLAQVEEQERVRDGRVRWVVISVSITDQGREALAAVGAR